MKTIGAYEAKTHLPKLLERVTRGEKILITKHGSPIAVLQPPDPMGKTGSLKAIRELKKFRQQHTLKGLSIRGMMQAGRR